MSVLWTSEEAQAATGGEGPRGWQATGASIDSRNLSPGDLFVALQGEQRDGHDFVRNALDRGAVAAMVSHRPAGMAAEAPLLVVDDTLEGLEALGRAARRRSRARIVAVTGSVGKTGTKEALRLALSGQGPTHASAASYNNHWGVPLSLARLPSGARFAVFEIGMNHAGEIRDLVRQVKPHVALVTWVGAAHLAHFKDEAEIAAAKGEIFEAVEPGGTAVLPADNRHFPLLEALARAAGIVDIVTFGQSESADWRLLDMEVQAERSSVVASRSGETLRFTVGSPGRHWVFNSLAVLAATEKLGADVGSAARALAALEPPAGRGRRIPVRVQGGRASIIDESYNANPMSMRAAIAQLGLMEGRRVAALGDMLELGEQAPALHAQLAGALESAGVASLFTCGPMMAHLRDALPAGIGGAHAIDSAALLPYVREALQPGDVLLVKGSLGSRMSLLVRALTEEPEAASTVERSSASG